LYLWQAKLSESLEDYRRKIMIQNERQYKITQTKLREFEQELAAINPTQLHPRQVIGWTNSYKLTIGKLKQEIEEYE
jgi:HTH-type transcriptional regulator / antitoxin HipB